MEKASFDKAQALISAQVYHEIRNALSSVIAMSEMTSALRLDPSMSSKSLVSSVDDMMDQTGEVVRYSLTMLNNILDINKIKTGSFNINPTRFNLSGTFRLRVHKKLTTAFRSYAFVNHSPFHRAGATCHNDASSEGPD